MGISRFTYLGPYAELPLTLQTHKVDQCQQKANCPNPTQGVFCSTCGIQVANRFHEYQDANPPLGNLLYKEFKESLMQADGMSGPQRLDDNHVIFRIVGNTRPPNQPREFWLDEQADLWIDLSKLDQKEELAWFKQAFAQEWFRLEETYGGLKFAWGLLQWFH